MMDGLLRGWSEAHPQDSVTVFGPVSLRLRAAALSFEMIEVQVGLPPRRILQQQVELPFRRLAQAADVVIVPNLACSIARLGAPIVGTLCDLRHLRRPREFSLASRVFRGAIWTASARRMSAVASISEFSLREADDLGFQLPLERAVVPLGLDHVRRGPGLRGKRNTVVCVSHRRSKGLSAVPSVWANVQRALGRARPDLIITGVPQAQHPNLIRVMAEAGVIDGFRVTNFLADADLHRTIAEARAVLYLSAYEGYGFVPSEATILGTHSFVYDLEPFRERSRQLSITAVPVDDAPAIARELTAYLLADPVDVVVEQPPVWADTAAAYRVLAERALRATSG